ncbi:MAG: hypothetical protein NZ484_00550 [Patescibacteria group bacterium]|nr:hypothetical protein [Patescibacteria group bacterium]MCX7589455.1 hypothetical protein [Patescibacteria group bacterium]MDW8279633.1 hypothetical protein [bacterium]
MIIYIYVEDNWRAIQRKNELIQKFNEKHPKSIINIFDLEENHNLEQLLNFLENQSLFTQKKLGIVYNLFKLNQKEIITKIKSILNDQNTYILIYEQNKPPKIFNFLTKKPTIFENFEILKGKKWLNFATQEIQKRNLILSNEALNTLNLIYEGNSFGFINEIEKISLLNKKNIDQNDLININIEISPNFWNLLNQLKNKNLSLRLQAFERIISLKEPLGKIFNILSYNWPEKIDNFAKYDLAIKSGKIEYEEALLDSIL